MEGKKSVLFRVVARSWVVFSFCLLPSAFCLPSAAAQTPKPAPTPAAAAAAAAPRGPLTYDAFRLVHTRNVFDPDRRPVRTATTTPTTSGRSDYVALTGTMINADKSYAFFSGSRSEFNRVIAVGDKIANARLTAVTPLNIVVERDGRRTTVAVGQTVPLDAKSAPGAPPVSEADTAAPNLGSPETGSNPAAATAATTTTAAPPANAANAAPGAGAVPGAKPPAGNKEDLIRKMMERRQQDLK